MAINNNIEVKLTLKDEATGKAVDNVKAMGGEINKTGVAAQYSLGNLVKRFIGLGAAIAATRMAIRLLSQTFSSSWAEMVKQIENGQRAFTAEYKQIKQLDEQISTIKGNIGEGLQPVMIAWKNTTIEILQAFEKIFKFTSRETAGRSINTSMAESLKREAESLEDAIKVAEDAREKTVSWYNPSGQSRSGVDLSVAKAELAAIRSDIDSALARAKASTPGLDPDFLKRQEEERRKAAAAAAAAHQKEFDQNVAASNAMQSDLQQRVIAQAEYAADIQTIKQEQLEYDQQWLENERALETEAIELTNQATQARAAAAEFEMQATINAVSQSIHSTAALMQLGVENSKKSAEDKKRILLAIAIAEGAASAVTAIKAGWDSAGGNVYLGIIQAAAAGLEATVATAVQIAAIQNASFAKGGQFVTSGPQQITVGDNPGGREMVSVTPLSSPNINGPQGGGVTVGDTIINISGPVDQRKLRSALRENRREIERMFRYGYISPSRLGLAGAA
jgi:hypothetical protein